MQILQTFLNIFVVIYLFIGGLIFPFISYMLPLYKIRKVNKNILNIFLVNIASLIVIYYFNEHLAVYYVIGPCLIEFLFYILFNNRKIRSIYDKCVIGALVTSIAITYYFQLNIGTIKQNLLLYLNTNILQDTIDKEILYQGINLILNNMFLIVFFTVYMSFILIYFSILKIGYQHWSISPLWILFFVIPIVLDRILNINNLYLQYMLEISKTIYLFFGIKSLYKLLCNNNNKMSFLKHLFSVIIGINLPFATFIFGALMSFGLDKINLKIKFGGE